MPSANSCTPEKIAMMDARNGKPGMRVPWIELVERVVPGARAEVVSGVGHFTMLEAPDAVSTVIEEVVQRAGA